MKIAFVYTEGRLRRVPLIEERAAPTEFLYGAEELGASHEIARFEVARGSDHGVAGRMVDRLFSAGWLPNRTRGWVLLSTRRLLSRLNAFDVAVATSTGLAFSLGIWKTLGLLKPEIVAIHCGIFNYRPNAWRRAQIRFLLRRMWTLIYGEGEYEAMRRVFSIPAERLDVNCFGVDHRFWTPDPAVAEEDFVLSAGNDGRRDYSLLVRTARELPFPFMILTRQVLPQPLPPNVRVVAGSWHEETVSDRDLRDLYRRARCVVIPLVESIQPSGQSVCLQAMACGKAVILTRTAGLWSPTQMRDGANVVFVRPGDGDGLRQAVRRVSEDSALRAALGNNARQTVEASFTADAFAARMADLCAKAIKGGRGRRRE